MIKALKVASIIVIIMCFGCKSTKRITSSGELNNKLSSNQIIKAHSKSEANFKTFQARVKASYVQGDQSQSHTVNLRMEKDKTIWINSFLSVVRVKITPEKVGYYNKLDNTYFDGDFSLISDLLGTELDFEKVQNMLLGEALFNLEDNNYSADIHEKSYVLQPKQQNKLLEIFLLFNPAHFKMDSQQLWQNLKHRMLQIDYKTYQEIDKQILPKNIEITATEENYATIINMEFKSIILDGDLRFPFRIPSGFEEIVIK